MPKYAAQGHTFLPVVMATELPADSCAAAISLATTDYFVPLMLRINKPTVMLSYAQITKSSCHCSLGRVPLRLSYITPS